VLDVVASQLSQMVRPVNQLVLERLTVDIGIAAQIAEIGRTFKMQGLKQGHGCFFQGQECPVVSGWPEMDRPCGAGDKVREQVYFLCVTQEPARVSALLQWLLMAL